MNESRVETIASLRGAVAVLADRLDQLAEAESKRTGLGSDGGERTVVDLARRAAHEVQHHLHDVERITKSVR